MLKCTGPTVASALGQIKTWLVLLYLYGEMGDGTTNHFSDTPIININRKQTA